MNLCAWGTVFVCISIYIGVYIVLMGHGNGMSVWFGWAIVWQLYIEHQLRFENERTHGNIYNEKFPTQNELFQRKKNNNNNKKGNNNKTKVNKRENEIFFVLFHLVEKWQPLIRTFTATTIIITINNNNNKLKKKNQKKLHMRKIPHTLTHNHLLRTAYQTAKHSQHLEFPL